MRLFNDMVSAILHCDKPVICRVNGMRIAGGQEIGMACDFSIAQDLAALRSGRAAARLGSRRRQHRLPAALRRHRGGDGELHALRAVERAQGLPPGPDQPHRAGAQGRRRVRAQPAGRDRPLDGRVRPHRATASTWKGDELAAAKATAAVAGASTSTLLDREVDALVLKLAKTMPGCLTKTIESVRKHKLAHWDRTASRTAPGSAST